MDQDLEAFTIIVGLRMSQRTIISTELLLLLMVMMLSVTYGEPVRLTQESSSHSAIITISTTLTTLRTLNCTNLTTGLIRRQFSLTTFSLV